MVGGIIFVKRWGVVLIINVNMKYLFEVKIGVFGCFKLWN